MTVYIGLVMRCSAGLPVGLICQKRDGFSREHSSLYPKLRSSGQTTLCEPGQWHALSGLQQQEQTAQKEEGRGHGVMQPQGHILSDHFTLCFSLSWGPLFFSHSKAFFHYQYLSYAIILCSLHMKRLIIMTWWEKVQALIVFVVHCVSEKHSYGCVEDCI